MSLVPVSVSFQSIVSRFYHVNVALAHTFLRWLNPNKAGLFEGSFSWEFFLHISRRI